MSAEGTWDTTIDTPMGKQKGTLVFSQTADGGWDGTSRSPDGEETKLDKLVVKDDQVSWEQTVTKPMKLNVKCSITIDGDTFSGKAKPGMFPAVTMTGERTG
jgi:hypothetical protein